MLTDLMKLDIQIFDPEIQTAQSTTRGDSRGNEDSMPTEPPTVATAA